MGRSEHHQVDLNRADAEELMTITGIDGERARLILDYRKEHGAFRSWDDVQKVEGIGPTLAEHARAEATLGEEAEESASAADEDTSAEAADETVGEEGETEDEASDTDGSVTDEEEIGALLAIAQLDAEASAAYDLAAESVDDPKLRELLQGFGADHRRHVDDLRALVETREYEFEVPDVGEQSVLLALASAVGGLDPTAAVEAMIANEHLTNGTYQTALWLVSDEAALEVIRRNREDERRHLETLRAYAEQE